MSNDSMTWKPDSILSPGIVDIAQALADSGEHFDAMRSATAGRLRVLGTECRFGEALATYREQAIGVSGRAFARMLDVSGTTQSRLESGEAGRLPSPGYLVRLRWLEIKRRTHVVKLDSRTGTRAVPGAMRLDRMSRFGNPFVCDSAASRVPVEWRRYDREACVRAFIYWVLEPQRQSYLDGLPELFGKSLACWGCPEICHGHAVVALVRRYPWSGRLIGSGVDPEEVWREACQAARVSWAVELLRRERAVVR